MRSLVLILLVILIDYYAYQAFRSAINDWSKSPRQIFTIVYFLISLAVLFILFGGKDWMSTWSRSLQIYSSAFAFIVVFSKMFVAIFVLIDDLRRLILWLANFFVTEPRVDFSRSEIIVKLGIIMGAVPFFTLLYGIVRNQYRYKLHESDIPISNLPKALDGLRIVQISDIHSGSFTLKDPIQQGIKMINDLDADVIVFTGDLVNTVAEEMEPYLEIFSQLRSKYGTYSVMGNHDYGDYKSWPSIEEKAKNLARLKDTHAQLGWKLLLNQTEQIEIDGARLAIIGVENISAQVRFRTYGDLGKAYEGALGADFKMLLSHDPSHWSAEVTESYQDIGLTLSGHTHGFQFGIEIPGWIKWSPSKYVYKQWAGLYTKQDQHLYVNRGFGTLGYPGRVGILPEITLLQLKSV